MLEALARSLENAFVQFSIRRLMYLLFVITVFVGGAYVVDRLTGYTYYSRVEHQLGALERLQRLEAVGANASPALGPIYDSLVASVRAYQVTQSIVRLNPRPWLKALVAASVPLFFVFFSFLKKNQGDPEWSDMLVGAVGVVILFAGASVFLPTFNSIWLTVASYTVGQVALLLALSGIMSAYQRTRRRGTPPAPHAA